MAPLDVTDDSEWKWKGVGGSKDTRKFKVVSTRKLYTDIKYEDGKVETVSTRLIRADAIPVVARTFNGL